MRTLDVHHRQAPFRRRNAQKKGPPEGGPVLTISPYGPGKPGPQGLDSTVIGALAVRHGVEAFTLLFFSHAQTDGHVDQLERDRRDDA
jgi:hypothetical protein